MDTTTAGLIQLVKERETIPDSGTAYSDPVLLNYLDQAMKGFIVPAIEAVLEEHFVVTMDKQLPKQPTYQGSMPTDVVNWIEIPGASTGLRLRDVYLVGNDGSFYNLPRLTPTQAAAQTYGNPWGPYLPPLNTQTVGGFYLQGNRVMVFPYILASDKIIRITFQRAPGDLCLTSDAGKVIAKSGDTLTLDKVLPWTAGTRVNAISGELPHDYVQDGTVPVTVYTSYTPLSDVPLVSVAANTVAFPTGTAANIQVGDWICPRGQSVFAQNIPKELIPVLVQKAAEMCLEAAGDREGQQVANGTFKSMLSMAIAQITPRVQGKPVKLIPTNSPFKASRGANFGRW